MKLRNRNAMIERKLCLRHNEKNKGILVDSSKCELCKLENAFNNVLNQKEFRDLRP